MFIFIKLILIAIPVICAAISIHLSVSLLDDNCNAKLFHIIAISSIIITIISTLVTYCANKLNPYPIYELNEYEYNYFVENDYGPETVRNYIETKKEYKESNQIEKYLIDNIVKK